MVAYVERLNLGFSVERLPRTHFIQQQYDQHKQEVNLHDHVLNTYLKDREYNLVKNNFPLALDETVAQYVLWVRNNVQIDVEKFVKTRFPCKRTVIFTNPTQWKSIPTIIHYHVFVEESPCPSL